MKLNKCLIVLLIAGYSAAGLSQGLNIVPSDAKTVEATKDSTYDPTTDKTVKVDDKDPLKGTVDVPQNMLNSVYLGFSYYGVPGCQRLAGYYGFPKVSYLGPYIVYGHYEGGYWWGGYWVPVYWVPPYTVTYCYGVR